MKFILGRIFLGMKLRFDQKLIILVNRNLQCPFDVMSITSKYLSALLNTHEILTGL